MGKIKISKQEFGQRIQRIKEKMASENLDAIFVYGDEYRKENLRYVSNYWPIFERGALLMGINANPIVLCAPECEKVAGEMSVWEDIRLVPDFGCVTVPDAIEYPLAQYTSFGKLAQELKGGGKLNRLGVVGMDAIPCSLLNVLKEAFGCELVDANHILFSMRLIKSPDEMACLREAARIADAGYEALMNADLIGKTELQAVGILEGKARAEGAEHVIFSIFGSGERTNTIVGRPTDKIIEDGDMIMCAVAIQYEGYVASCEVPFAVGNASAETKRVISVLVKAAEAGIPEIKPGNKMNNMVMAVRNCFREHKLEEYDVYPPLHGAGCAEAESPYPNENTEDLFEVGMAVNTDISLFGLPGGSNRIEESFVITEQGAQSLSPLVRKYCKEWLKNNP